MHPFALLSLKCKLAMPPVLEHNLVPIKDPGTQKTDCSSRGWEQCRVLGISPTPTPKDHTKSSEIPGFMVFMVWLLLLLTFKYWTKECFQKARGLGGLSGPMLWLYQVFYDLVSTYLNLTFPTLYTPPPPPQLQATCKIPVHPSWLSLRFTCSAKPFLHLSPPPYPHLHWSGLFFPAAPLDSV